MFQSKLRQKKICFVVKQELSGKLEMFETFGFLQQIRKFDYMAFISIEFHTIFTSHLDVNFLYSHSVE